VYGPNGTWDGGREKAPAALCRKVAECKLSKSDDIDIWGDGEQTRSFTYIKDCIYGTIKLMQSDIREPVNIGSSEMVSINELTKIIENIAGVTLKPVHDLSAPKGVRGRNSDNSKILKLLNWEPKISLNEGLKETYLWVEQQVGKKVKVK
jgi:nucleoside-diphosphate-sugar epimerase